MARRSATESAASFDVCRATNLSDTELVSGGGTLLMVLRLGGPESGSGP